MWRPYSNVKVSQHEHSVIVYKDVTFAKSLIDIQAVGTYQYI